MKDAWDRNRVENYFATYGTPIKPKAGYALRMREAASWVVGMSVLDIACGAGYFYSAVSLLDRSVRYRGIDASKYMVQSARSYFPEGDFAIGDGYDLSNEDVYDTVTSWSFLIHIPHEDIPKVLSGLWSRVGLALLFSIPIDRDETKTVELNRELPHADGETIITHVSKDTLMDMLYGLDPSPSHIVIKAWKDGAYGFMSSDRIVRVMK